MLHWESFLAFEEENNLFQLKEDGIYIWDIIRFPIYLDYMWENFREQSANQKLRHKLTPSVRRLGHLLTFLFKRARPNIFFTYSRDRMTDGRFYDKNADDFLQRLHQDSHIIETYQAKGSHYAYKVSLINPASLFNWLYYLFYRQKDYSFLLEKVNSCLGLNWDNKTINRHISYFRSEKLFYTLLFRFKKAKRVYMTQNGIQKALFCAARENGVETIEFQHGIIDKGHIAYNYPASVHADSGIYVPDMLLTFSEFWGQDINYPVKKIIATGNTVFANVNSYHKKFNPSSKTVGFISADVFGLKLAALAIEYAALNKKDKIIFKLHPNEFARKRNFDELFSEYPNITVLTNEQPTEEMVLSCDAIVLIQSTVAYQALQAGIPLFIYKRMTYYRHSHIFNSLNVKLIDNAGQIVVSSDREQGPGDVFFERFDESVYHRLSNSI